MDSEDNEGDLSGFAATEAPIKKPRILPDDLPKSLDDRKSVPVYTGETEMYDAWQGMHIAPPENCLKLTKVEY